MPDPLRKGDRVQTGDGLFGRITAFCNNRVVVRYEPGQHNDNGEPIVGLANYSRNCCTFMPTEEEIAERRAERRELALAKLANC